MATKGKKSLRELQKERQESRSLRDVAFMYGTALKDQEMLIKHLGAGWILPKSGFGFTKADGNPGRISWRGYEWGAQWIVTVWN